MKFSALPDVDQSINLGPQAPSEAILLLNEKFQSYIQETRHLVNTKLEELTSSISELRVGSYLKYALLSRGKRLRPILTILSSQSVGGDKNSVVALALAIELLHGATLVHDDVIDEDELRRDIPTIHKKWSINDAIIVGDAMISLAINLAADYGPDIMKIVSECGLELCEGELLDMSLSLRRSTEDDCFLKIKRKSASLFRVSAQVGALFGDGSPVEVESLARFGEYFGIAYQIRDDLLDLTENKIPSDLKNGRITLPIINFYNNSDSYAKNLLEENFGKNNIKRDTIIEIVDKMKETGSIAYCEQKIEENLREATASLSSIKESEFKTYLKDFSKFILNSAK